MLAVARYGGREATHPTISGVPTKRKCYCAVSKVLEPRGHLTLCSLVFRHIFAHSLPLFQWYNQLLCKRISFSYLKPVPIPVSLEKIKNISAKILTEDLCRQISRFGHGWGAGEGFDFVREALDIGFGRAFGLFGFGGAGGKMEVLHDE